MAWGQIANLTPTLPRRGAAARSAAREVVIADGLQAHRVVAEDPLHAAVELAEQAVARGDEARAHAQPGAGEAPLHPPAEQQEVPGEVVARGQAGTAQGVHVLLRDGDAVPPVEAIRQLEQRRVEGEQVVVAPRRECRQRPCQCLPLPCRVREGFGLEFEHQVAPTAERRHQLGQGGDQRQLGAQPGEGQLADHRRMAEHALRRGVVADDRHAVRGPADVALDAPDARSPCPLEGGEGIFQSPHVIVLPTVRNDPAVFEGSSRRYPPRYRRHQCVGGPQLHLPQPLAHAVGPGGDRASP